MQSGTPLLVAFGVSAIFALVGVGLLAWWVIARRRAAASQAWPAAPGQITSAMVHSFQRRDNEGDVTTYYEPRVEYAYTIAGETHTGKRIAFGAPASANRKRAEQAISHYAPGTAVEVYYNPARPADAVLERSVSNMLGALLAGIGLLGGSVAVFVFMMA